MHCENAVKQAGVTIRRMKVRRRFTLRILLIGIALLAIPLSWLAYHVNWIRQRHAFLRLEGVIASKPFGMVRPYPSGLKLLGEPKQHVMDVPAEHIQRAQELFPEAVLNLYYLPGTTEKLK
jgi:hypothetical protein